ncbi:hypothetical protein [Photobacterium indicum]|uniref:Uncharacterized protein n=1 Tax=Photobacterium indicum TaxID=81447 RepID=A0A2T3L3Y6_9GAMM|nr:hypothetical protein [Photobacterium indicum]PSV44052.1 hypothetical protein C9J47_20535 [Photobacterium indicum]
MLLYTKEGYIETLEYLKDRYVEEQARFNHFEAKCSKLLTFLTGVIGGLSIWAGFVKSTLFSPSTPVSWIQLFLFCLALICIACAWGHSLLAIKIGDCPVLPKSGAAAMYIQESTEQKRCEYIFECYVGTLSQLSEVIDNKSINLEHAYDELTYSAWALGILGIVTIGMEIII